MNNGWATFWAIIVILSIGFNGFLGIRASLRVETLEVEIVRLEETIEDALFIVTPPVGDIGIAREILERALGDSDD